MMRLRTLLTWTILMATLTTGLHAETVAELQKKQKTLEKELATTRKMLSETKKSETATMNKLNLIGQNIKTQRKIVKGIGQQIDALDREINLLAQKRSKLEAELLQHKEDYARMVRETHYAQMQQRPLLFLMSSSSFSQLTRRIRYMEEFATYRREQIEKITRTQALIDEQDQRLANSRREKKSSLDQQKREQENLSREERKQQKMMSELKKKEKDLNKQQMAQQKKVDEINRKIESIVRDQANKQEKTRMTKEQQLLSGGFAKNKGRLPWPIAEGHISRHYGKQQNEIHQYVMNDNRGTYFQTPRGAQARAVFDGTVTATLVMGNEYAVIVQHGAYRTVYSGLSSLNVKQGDNVSTKQILGTIRTDTTEDNKTELYFQIYEGKNILNPEQWLTH